MVDIQVVVIEAISIDAIVDDVQRTSHDRRRTSNNHNWAYGSCELKMYNKFRKEIYTFIGHHWHAAHLQ